MSRVAREEKRRQQVRAPKERTAVPDLAEAWLSGNTADIATALDHALELPDVIRHAHAIHVEELRKELDPTDDIAAILDRIWDLSSRAEKLNGDQVMRPGLELLCWTAIELRHLLPPFETRVSKLRSARRGDVRERHNRAFDALVPAGALFMADRALDQAAEIGNADRVARRAGVTAETVRVMPESKANSLALTCVRQILGARLPAETTDAQIIAAVAIYRKPQRPRGRPRKNERGASDEDRAKAVVSLMNHQNRDGTELMDSRSAAKLLRDYQAASDQRVHRLTGAVRKKETRDS